MFLKISLSTLLLVSLSQNAMEDSPKTIKMKYDISQITLMDIPQFERSLKSKFPNRMDPKFHAYAIIQTLEKNPVDVAYSKLEYLIKHCKVRVDAICGEKTEFTPLSLYLAKALTELEYLDNVVILLKLGANPLFAPGKNPSPFCMANEFRFDDRSKYPHAANLTKLLVGSMEGKNRAYAQTIVKESNQHARAILATFAQTNEFIKEAQEQNQ